MTQTLQGRDEAQMIASILAGDSQQFHQLIRPYERDCTSWRYPCCETKPMQKT